MSIRTSKAKERNVRSLMSRHGVTFVGVGRKVAGGKDTGEECVTVGVVKKLPLQDVPPKERLPKRLRPELFSLRFVKTDVVETGIVRALAAPTDKWRPAPGGVSIGHAAITAGTLGAVVRKGADRVILSNNHVLANSNSAEIGDPILQPGPHDGGSLDDRIGTLAAFVPIHFECGGLNPDQCRVAVFLANLLTRICRAINSKTVYRVYDEAEKNYVDAAVSRPDDDGFVDAKILGEDGEPTVTVTVLAELSPQDAVKKHGRTTGFKRGSVSSVGASVRVQYGEGKFAVLEDQIVISGNGFSAGGDSDSAILTDDDRLGGLLFAGSETTTIANRIERVFSALELTL